MEGKGMHVQLNKVMYRQFSRKTRHHYLSGRWDDKTHYFQYKLKLNQSLTTLT